MTDSVTNQSQTFWQEAPEKLEHKQDQLGLEHAPTQTAETRGDYQLEDAITEHNRNPNQTPEATIINCASSAVISKEESALIHIPRTIPYPPKINLDGRDQARPEPTGMQESNLWLKMGKLKDDDKVLLKNLQNIEGTKDNGAVGVCYMPKSYLFCLADYERILFYRNRTTRFSLLKSCEYTEGIKLIKCLKVGETEKLFIADKKSHLKEIKIPSFKEESLDLSWRPRDMDDDLSQRGGDNDDDLSQRIFHINDDLSQRVWDLDDDFSQRIREIDDIISSDNNPNLIALISRETPIINIYNTSSGTWVLVMSLNHEFLRETATQVVYFDKISVVLAVERFENNKFIKKLVRLHSGATDAIWYPFSLCLDSDVRTVFFQGNIYLICLALDPNEQGQDMNSNECFKLCQFRLDDIEISGPEVLPYQQDFDSLKNLPLKDYSILRTKKSINLSTTLLMLSISDGRLALSKMKESDWNFGWNHLSVPLKNKTFAGINEDIGISVYAIKQEEK